MKANTQTQPNLDTSFQPYQLAGIGLMVLGLGVMGYLLLMPVDHVFRYLATGATLVVLGVFMYSGVQITAGRKAQVHPTYSRLPDDLKKFGIMALEVNTPEFDRLFVTHAWIGKDHDWLILELDEPGVLIKQKGTGPDQRSISKLDGEDFTIDYVGVLRHLLKKHDVPGIIWVNTHSSEPSISRLSSNITLLQSSIESLSNYLLIERDLY